MLKTMKKTNIKGFSLIELMVVVAIIGILAAVAVPNFQRFQRKARQSEAKTLLGGIHTGMSTFRAEWEDYFGEFNDMGFAPDGQLLYGVGFLAQGNNPFLPTWMNGGGTSITTAAACGGDVLNCIAGPTPLASGGTWTNQNMGLPDTYTAGADADIGGVAIDAWTINNQKVLLNVTDGTF